MRDEERYWKKLNEINEREICGHTPREEDVVRKTDSAGNRPLGKLLLRKA